MNYQQLTDKYNNDVKKLRSACPHEKLTVRRIQVECGDEYSYRYRIDTVATCKNCNSEVFDIRVPIELFGVSGTEMDVEYVGMVEGCAAYKRTEKYETVLITKREA